VSREDDRFGGVAMTILDGMQPWVVLVLVIVVLVGVAVVTAARRRRSTVVIPAGGLPSVTRTVTDDPVQRHRAEVDRLAAEVPTPPDRAVAGLVERVRARYRIGQDSYQSLATKVRSELAMAGATGRAAAAWIVKRSQADLRWEVTFLAERAGASGRTSARGREAPAMDRPAAHQPLP
jgi:hypothetical protein